MIFKYILTIFKHIQPNVIYERPPGGFLTLTQALVYSSYYDY